MKKPQGKTYRPFVCPHKACNQDIYSFARHNDLINHLMCDHNCNRNSKSCVQCCRDEANPRFYCSFCDYKCLQVQNILRHLRTQHGVQTINVVPTVHYQVADAKPNLKAIYKSVRKGRVSRCKTNSHVNLAPALDRTKTLRCLDETIDEETKTIDVEDYDASVDALLQETEASNETNLAALCWPDAEPYGGFVFESEGDIMDRVFSLLNEDDFALEESRDPCVFWSVMSPVAAPMNVLDLTNEELDFFVH